MTKFIMMVPIVGLVVVCLIGAVHALVKAVAESQSPIIVLLAMGFTAWLVIAALYFNHKRDI